MQYTAARRLTAWSLLYACLLVVPALRAADDDTRTLRGGWYQWDPYQYLGTVDGAQAPKGLDIDLLTAIMRSKDYAVVFDNVPWEEHLRDIAEGRRDLAGGAYRTPERETYAYFSEPYRVETDVLVVPRGADTPYRGLAPEALLRKLAEEHFRLGVARGYSYGPVVDAWLANPANAPFVRVAPNDEVNLARLLKGEIDGFLADRLVAATIAWRSGVQHRLGGYFCVVYSANVYAIFSKKTVSPETVAAFNDGLHLLKATGQYNRLTQEYGIPILLGITVNERWFAVLEIIGTIAFAISGVIIARRERYDIFGAFVLAALPAIGGGVLRDLLVGRTPIGLLRNPGYLYLILGTVVAGLIFYKLRDAFRSRHPHSASPRLPWHEHVYLFSDAVGLAAFSNR